MSRQLIAPGTERTGIFPMSRGDVHTLCETFVLKRRNILLRFILRKSKKTPILEKEASASISSNAKKPINMGPDGLIGENARNKLIKIKEGH